MGHRHSVQARIYEQLDRAPNRRAFAFYDEHNAITWLSRAQLYRRSSRAAAHLAHHGLGRGDVCVIVLPSGTFAATLIVGVLLRGAIPVLVAPPVVQGSLLDLPRILRHTVQKTKARLVVCAASMADRREALEAEITGTRFLFGEQALYAEDEANDEAAEIPRRFPSADDVAALQLTSGTTGFPRVCVWNQRGVLAALDGMAEAMQLTEDDVCFNWTPLYHDMGLVNNLLLCLTHGVPLVLWSPHAFVKRPAHWLRGLSETGATLTWSPNFGYALAAQRARDRQLDGVRLDRVRAFWNAAERIHYDTMQAFHRRFAPYGVTLEALKTNFGCAENVGGATFSALDASAVVEHVDRAQLYEERRAQPVDHAANGRDAVAVVSVGRPHPALDVQILSDAGAPLPDGHVGEIALDTPSRLVAYLDDPEATRQALDGDLLRTGDLGYRRGDDLFWVGRVQERITVRGKKLDPSDFEPILFDIEGLREGCFVVFGVDDDAQGTQHIVVISEVRLPLARALDEISADIYRQTFLRLGVTVSEVELVRPGTLTKTSSGKRRHRHFRRLYTDGELEPFVVEAAASEDPRPANNP